MFEIDYLNLYVWQGGDNYAQNNVQPFLPANINISVTRSIVSYTHKFREN